MEQSEKGMRVRLRELYYGHTATARRFRFALLCFDLITILFFIISSMLPLTSVILSFDLFIAVILAIDYAARMSISNRAWRFVLQFTSIMDLIVIVSMLAPFAIENLGFLRVTRMLRLLRSYHVLADLRQHSHWFRRNEETVISATNLFIFVFVVTAIVYVVEGHRNPEINNYVDALYFSVTTLTTTGFGDITMTDTSGRLLAIIIMVFGVSLFLRLVQTIFRPPRLYAPCSECGLKRHEADAVHCKHCGNLLKMPDVDE